MDVDALYPSIDIEFSVDRCIDLIFKSEVEFVDVNINELGLYLSLTEKREILQNNNLLQYCPKRKMNRGRRLLLLPLQGCLMRKEDGKFGKNAI